jgi:hypothetical protein
MVATGHKTMSVLKRYNTVSRDELKALVSGKWSNMDTYPESATKKGQAIGA